MKKILSYIKRDWKFILFVIVLFAVLTIRLPYSIYGPGGKIDLSNRYKNEIYETKGSLNITYISAYPGTLPIIGLSYLIPNWDLVKNDDIKFDNETYNDAKKRDKILNDAAVSNSIYVAYKKANIDLNITKYKLYVTYIHPDAKTDLKIGDIVESVDGKKYDNHIELTDYIKSHDLDYKVSFKVKDGNKEVDRYGIISNINDNKLIGIAFTVIYEYDNNPNITFKTKSNELGSSGGLMMSLYVYNSLIEEDITKGYDIAGTGTIELDGTVGEIDGVKYKILGAYKKGIRVFIVPEQNYEEAKKVVEENKLNLKVINVSTFDETINKLKELK